MPLVFQHYRYTSEQNSLTSPDCLFYNYFFLAAHFDFFTMCIKYWNKSIHFEKKKQHQNEFNLGPSSRTLEHF